MIWLWTELKVKAAIIGAILVGVLLAVLRIKQSGRNEERAKNAEATLKAVKKSQGVKHEVDRLPDGGAADRLRKHWSRD